MHTNQFVYYFFITDTIMSMIKLGVNNVNFYNFWNSVSFFGFFFFRFCSRNVYGNTLKSIKLFATDMYTLTNLKFA